MVTDQIEQQYRNNALRIRAIQYGIETPYGAHLKDINLENLAQIQTQLEDNLRKEYETEFSQVKNLVRKRLIISNLLIIVLAGISGYFLAGITLDPIQQTVEEQKRFIADASHELKTPITALQTSLEVNLNNKNLDKNVKQIFKENLEEVESLSNLTKNLLNLARYQANASVLTCEEFDLKEIINKVSKKFQPLAKKKEISITLKLDSSKISADIQKIEELLSILIDNAIKYTNPKGKIIVSNFSDKKNIYFTVKDNGVGICQIAQQHIFSRFYRSDTSRCKNNETGFGLGLSIAQNIVDLHHGQIKFKSKEDVGTEFTVKLPYKQ